MFCLVLRLEKLNIRPEFSSDIKKSIFNFSSEKFSVHNTMHTEHISLTVKDNYRNYFTKLDFRFALDRLKNTSEGPDGIPVIFFKYLPVEIIDCLVYLCNCCIYFVFCPEQWTYAYFVPVKTPNLNPNLYTSYRPIAISSAFLKIMERMMLQLLSFDVKNKISDKQHYAIKNKSCITNLIQTKKLILHNFEEMRDTYVVYFRFISSFRFSFS